MIRKAAGNLFNEVAFQNANLGNAVEAVQEAAFRKARRDFDQDVEPNTDLADFTEGADIFLL